MRRTSPVRALAALFASAPLFAQQIDLSAQPTTTQPKERWVNDRRQDQQDRIANGALTGRLTLPRPRILKAAKQN